MTYIPDIAPLLGGRLIIDLGALIANYRQLVRLALPGTAGVTIKADAYGLGLEPIAKALWQAGATDFFVAVAAEGVTLKKLLPDAQVFVLHGVTPMSVRLVQKAGLIPCLGSPQMLTLWRAFGNGAPCALHIDTGMTRLGLSLDEAKTCATNDLDGLNPVLLMTHFACADSAEHPKNTAQIDSFNAAKALFPQLKTSLQNSAGLFLGDRAASDVARLGIALYGGEAVNDLANPMKPVVTVQARIMHVRNVKKGDTISYGATHTFERDSRVAVASIGYADGYHRALSGSGVALRQDGSSGAYGYIAGETVPLVGRVTMDQTMFDVTDLPHDAVQADDFIELFGPHIAFDDAARTAGTIGYELLTSLGQRYGRHYLEPQQNLLGGA